MQFNGSAVNGAGLNSSARITFLLAFCALAGSANVSAEPVITRYCASQVAGTAAVSTTALQRHTAKAVATCTASVLAIEPYQTFATSAVSISAGSSYAQAVVTRYLQATVSSWAQVAPSAKTKQVAAASLVGLAEVVAVSKGIRPGFSAVVAAANVAASPYVRRHGSGAVSGTASVIAQSAFVQLAKSAAGGTASITAFAGYGNPSATVVTAGAQVFAYARANRQAKAAIVSSAKATAKGWMHTYGASNISGSAQVGAWVVQLQGTSTDTVGTAEVFADATYVHESRSVLGGSVDIDAAPYVIRHDNAVVVGGAGLRSESTLNNLLDGYANPGTLSTIFLNAQGVVVAPLISHFDGSSNVDASATYIHRAKADSNSHAQVTATGVYTHQAIASIDASVDVASEAHWLWAGSADVLGTGFELEGQPVLSHKAKSDINSSGLVVAVATRTQRAAAFVGGKSDVVIEASIYRMGFADLLGEVLIVSSPATVGGSTARDPVERTMYRRETNRTLYRPFVDRVMKARRT